MNTTPAFDFLTWLNEWPAAAIIAWGVVFLLILLRQAPAKLIANLAVANKKATYEHQARLARNKLMPGIGIMLLAGAIFIAWELTPPVPRFDTFLANLALSVLIAGFFYLLYKITGLTWFWLKPVKGTELPTRRSARHYLSAALRIIVLVVGILSVLSVWVRNIAGVIAGLGIGGLAVALAAQDTLANFFGSLALMFDHPFVLGDYITTPELEGTVIRVGLRSSQLRRPDQTIVHVPNKTLASTVIINLSQRTERRVENMVYLSLTNDPAAVTDYLAALAAAIRADDDVVNKDETVVDIAAFTERSIAVRMRFFTLQDYNVMLRTSGRLNTQALQLAKDHRLSLAVYSETNTP